MYSLGNFFPSDKERAEAAAELLHILYYYQGGPISWRKAYCLSRSTITTEEDFGNLVSKLSAAGFTRLCSIENEDTKYTGLNEIAIRLSYKGWRFIRGRFDESS